MAEEVREQTAVTYQSIGVSRLQRLFHERPAHPVPNDLLNNQSHVRTWPTSDFAVEPETPEGDWLRFNATHATILEDKTVCLSESTPEKEVIHHNAYILVEGKPRCVLNIVQVWLHQEHTMQHVYASLMQYVDPTNGAQIVPHDIVIDRIGMVHDACQMSHLPYRYLNAEVSYPFKRLDKAYPGQIRTTMGQLPLPEHVGFYQHYYDVPLSSRKLYPNPRQIASCIDNALVGPRCYALPILGTPVVFPGAPNQLWQPTPYCGPIFASDIDYKTRSMGDVYNEVSKDGRPNKIVLRRPNNEETPSVPTTNRAESRPGKLKSTNIPCPTVPSSYRQAVDCHHYTAPAAIPSQPPIKPNSSRREFSSTSRVSSTVPKLTASPLPKQPHRDTKCSGSPITISSDDDSMSIDLDVIPGSGKETNTAPLTAPARPSNKQTQPPPSTPRAPTSFDSQFQRSTSGIGGRSSDLQPVTYDQLFPGARGRFQPEPSPRYVPDSPSSGCTFSSE